MNIKIICFICVISASFLACRQNYVAICSDYTCLENNKNKPAVINGVLQEYSPDSRVNGKLIKFWKYEILLNDSVAIPIKDSNENYDKYLGKEVSIKGLIYYGIVAGEDDGKSSNATGFRIEIDKIEGKK